MVSRVRRLLRTLSWLSLPPSVGIFIARDSVDSRKSHDGLHGLVRDQFGDDR